MVRSEARNNHITACEIYNDYDPDTGNGQFAFGGIRRLYAAARARPSARGRSGRRACSDLRGNKLRDFELEDFLSLALQLEEL